MGMDVYGKAASSDAGEYFRASVWGWHPLWTYCEQVAPELTGLVQYGHSNDGDGLNGDEAEMLGLKLLAEVESGRTARYVAERDAALAALPLERCEWCDGTGTRTDEVGVRMGMDKKNWCNACDGRGEREQWATSYGLDVATVREFGLFLVDSGGFEIW